MERTLVIIAILAALASPLEVGAATFTADLAALRVDQESRIVAYDNWSGVPVGPAGSLPAENYLLPLAAGESLSAIRWQTTDSTMNDWHLAISELEETTTAGKLRARERLGRQAVELVGQIVVGGERLAELMLFPVTVDSTGTLVLHRVINVTVGQRQISSSELISRDEYLRADQANRKNETAAQSGSVEYLVITSADLADAMAPLVKYRNEVGLSAELRLIEDILLSQSGVDDAEKLREFLKLYYSAGGKYVLLAGDETVVPIRYAYHYEAVTMPPLYNRQVCDLYFADLTGDWDVDGDGIYGERYSDLPDQTPELRVGRLPINTPEEATRYIAALITYETNPGLGDAAYLTDAFFFSGDQMRDYPGGGQHQTIAEVFPDWFGLDTLSGVEAASGADPAPTNLPPTQFGPIFEPGFGIINIIAHGRSDGFVVRSAGYNDWPKDYLLTGEAVGGHGQMDDLAATDKPSFYYSLACDNGGFDMDQPPLNHTRPILVQSLIGSGSAVGFVAYSRWGWISSSYLLQRSFFEYLFDHPEQPAIEAMYASKAAYYYYRDLVYGQNFYGDPALRVYADVPARTQITSLAADSGLAVTIKVGEAAAAHCRLIISAAGNQLAEYVADIAGTVLVDYPLDDSTVYRFSAAPPGATVGQMDYLASMVTDLDDETADAALPDRFALHQNYPNPFNPSTTISFELPQATTVSLTVLNVLGQTVAMLIDSRQAAGVHQVAWSGQDENGRPVASGLYFYRLQSGAEATVRKMILLK